MRGALPDSPGVDDDTGNDRMVGGQIFYINIGARVPGTGSGGIDGKYGVPVDPWVYMISVGKKF
jgi:outer membrane protein W